MRAPRAVLLCVLVLCFLPTRQAQDPVEDSELSGNVPEDGEVTFPSTIAPTTADTALQTVNASNVEEGGSQLEFLLILVIPLASSIFLLGAVIFLVKHCKGKNAKQEPSSQGSQSALQSHELGSENLKVPIFEEDTPSVMEIEMEELDKWMSSLHEDGGCLPPLKEEKEPNLSPSDH